MDAEKIRILLVEDDALNYLDIQNVLQEEGYEVLSHPQKPFIDNYEDAIAVSEITIPHIAILDIHIKGKRDGIEIGLYIRENYYSPVIFLSSFNTDENLRRSGIMGADAFVVKLGKPLEMKQLKTDIRRLLPLAENAAAQRKEGATFYVKEITSPHTTHLGFRKTRILWNDLSFVRTTPESKNSVVFWMKDEKKFLYHTSLTDCAATLPWYFIRFSGQEVINGKLFTQQGKSEWVCFMGNQRYEVKEAYRTEQTLANLRRLFR